MNTIIFDLDNTLIWDEKSTDEALDATCEAAAQSEGIPAMLLKEAVLIQAQSTFKELAVYSYLANIEVTAMEAMWARFDDGTASELLYMRKKAPLFRKEVWENGLKELGVHNEELAVLLAETFPIERRKRPYIYEDTVEVLHSLSKAYPLMLLTNGTPDLQKEKLLGVSGLSAFFRHIVISGEVGWGKPSPKIFEHCMALAGLCAGDCFMVGDNLYTDILGANGTGMANAWLNRSGKRPPSDAPRPTFEIRSLREVAGLLL
ncbi:HAD family hydrolase [Paenibacillus sp. LHD-38]|uniref:HAD family hydrolase n=1 Tax=Paenibacillus sp. LHD-38 TaxID=3072143 RepID=UPI00280C8ED3|nr:HAD family hydrolase [Paenibacillus sp. LHD-38]MDQ8735208.1 HAD family hydrolase [Paenibacillus sp. LHD-38]